METKLNLFLLSTSDASLTEKQIKDFKTNPNLEIECYPYENDKTDRASDIILSYGTADMNNNIRFSMNLDDLEIFATALLKKIEIFRRNNEETIKERVKHNKPF